MNIKIKRQNFKTKSSKYKLLKEKMKRKNKNILHKISINLITFYNPILCPLSISIAFTYN